MIGCDMPLQYTKLKHLNMKDHPEFNERWLQKLISDDPSILGLGSSVVALDFERPQPRAGRLDLLLQDRESDRRYELELQLGATDESHVIRTIEYWDIERKRYPQYEHCAVIIAEEITSRFLNVISLFNGSIPLIAIQVRAFEISGQMSVLFTKVLDEMPRGLVGEDERTIEVTDRDYWVKEVGTQSLEVLDGLLPIIQKPRPDAQLNFNKHHIGIAEHGVADNFVTFHPRKKSCIVSIKIPQTEETDAKINASDIETLPYEKTWRMYWLRLTTPELGRNEELLTELINAAAVEDAE